MGKLKKIRKLTTGSKKHADRAVKAAERAEAAERRMVDLLAGRAALVGGDNKHDSGRAPFYTAPAAETR
jgi:hypothetical protein